MSDFKYAHLYDTGHLRGDLRKRSVHGGIWTLGLQGILIAIGLTRGAILARLLTPDDYGLQAMVLAIVSLALIFKDLGLSTAIIQEEQITHQQVSNLFWLNATLGFFSMCVVVILGPVMVWFYNEPRMVGISLLLSFAYLFGGLSIQPQALMQRQMRFGGLALVNLAATVCATIIGIYLAIAGFKYWALVWMEVLISFFLMVGLWLQVRWLPALPKRGSSVSKMIKTGGNVAGLNIFATLAKNIDSILLGKFCGTFSLGLYSRGLQLHHLIENQLRNSISSVALPGLSALQSSRETFRNYFLRYIAIVAYATMPLACFLFFFSAEVIRYYLGVNWMAAVPYLEILAINAFFSSVIACLALIPLALGRSRRYLHTGILKGMVRMMGIAIGVIGWGAIGAAYGLLFSDFVFWWPYLKLTLFDTDIKISDYVRTLLTPLAISIVAGLCAKFLFTTLGYNSLPGFLFIMCLYFSLYLLLYGLADYYRIGCDLNFTRVLINKISCKRI